MPGPHSESRRRHWSGGRQRYVQLPRVPLSRAAGQGHRCGGERRERCVFTDSQVGRERNEKRRLPNGRLEAATPGRGVRGPGALNVRGLVLRVRQHRPQSYSSSPACTWESVPQNKTVGELINLPQCLICKMGRIRVFISESNCEGYVCQ